MSKEKKKQLTELQVRFLDVLFEEAQGDLSRAKELAGYSPNTSVSEIVASLSDEIAERALKSLAGGAAEAFFGLLSVLRSPNQLGASNKLKAASQILDRAGIVKKTETIDLKVPETGIVILPAKKVVKEDVALEDVEDVEEDK